MTALVRRNGRGTRRPVLGIVAAVSRTETGTLRGATKCADVSERVAAIASREKVKARVVGS